MKFAHIIHAVYYEPWLISEEGHAAIVQLLESRLARDINDETFKQLAAVSKPGAMEFGAKPPMDVVGGVATIPIHGTIAKGISGIQRACGACGVEDVRADMAEAIDRPDVRAIVLSIDSPGGSVAGVPELASFIRGCAEKKPVVAHTDGLMGSAAYWLGSQADEIVASPSARLGSIGVFVPFVDRSRAAEMQGMKVEVIKNKEGIHKGVGIPGTSLSEAGREYIQEGVQDLFDMFKGAIHSRRPGVPASAMTGKAYLADKAKKEGLCDSIGAMSDARSAALALCELKQKHKVR